MTYGWAILAVLITIAALAYFGVLNPARFLPESCTLFPGLACTDVVVGKSAAVITIRNGIGNSLSNMQIGLSGLPCTSPQFSLADGETKSIAMTGPSCNLVGKSLKNDITITYTIQSLSHTNLGRLSSSIGQGNMVAYYSFDDGTAKDLSGFGNNGNLPGGSANPTFLNSGCISGGCFSFDGVDDLITVSDSSSLNSQSFSISMNVKPITLKAGAANFNLLMGRENYLITGFRYGIGSIEGSRNIYFWATQSGGSLSMNSGGNQLTLGAFSDVLITYDSTSQTGKIFINGIQAGSAVGSYNMPSGRTLIINGDIGGTAGSNSIIDEIKIYDYAIR